MRIEGLEHPVVVDCFPELFGRKRFCEDYLGCTLLPDPGESGYLRHGRLVDIELILNTGDGTHAPVGHYYVIAFPQFQRIGLRRFAVFNDCKTVELCG